MTSSPPVAAPASTSSGSAVDAHGAHPEVSSDRTVDHGECLLKQNGIGPKRRIFCSDPEAGLQSFSKTDQQVWKASGPRHISKVRQPYL